MGYCAILLIGRFPGGFYLPRHPTRLGPAARASRRRARAGLSPRTAEFWEAACKQRLCDPAFSPGPGPSLGYDFVRWG